MINKQKPDSEIWRLAMENNYCFNKDMIFIIKQNNLLISQDNYIPFWEFECPAPVL